MICRTTPHLQAKLRAHHADTTIKEEQGEFYKKKISIITPIPPHKPHEDAVKVLAVEVTANLIRSALYF